MSVAMTKEGPVVRWRLLLEKYIAWMQHREGTDGLDFEGGLRAFGFSHAEIVALRTLSAQPRARRR